MNLPARYYVQTWDFEKQEWSSQKGVRTGPYSLKGLRRALRKLQEMGYPADRSDPSIYVFRSDHAPAD